MQQEDNPISTDITLYCGSLSRIVYLKLSQVEKSFQYNGRNLISKITKQSIRNALSYRFPQKFIGQDYERVYLPCTPAIEILEMPVSQNNQELPILKTGWIKSPNNQMETLTQAFQSGKRSAVVLLNGELFRLKGCGNMDEGFVAGYGVNGQENSLEVRGCHFYHTVKRELLMSDYISQILRSYGFECGNESVGFYEYGQQKYPIQDFLPEIGKYCGVFKTLSDKRLGTHLLQGIQLFLMLSLKFSQNNQKDQQIKQEILRPYITIPSRIEQYSEEKANGGWHISTTFSLLQDKDQNELPDVKDSFRLNKIYDMKYEIENNLDSLNVFLNQPQRIFNFKGNEYTNYSKEIDELLLKLKVHPSYYPIIKGSIKEITNYDDVEQALFLLYDRLGFEIGRIKRILTENDVNWGYYRDHHQDLYHCNAHLNNFVVLSGRHNNLLAPLDFDLAFRKQEFISIEYDQETYGKFDEKLWNWFQDMERQSIELAIAGLEMIMNSVFFELDISKYFSPEIKKITEQIDVLLRDQMRIGFLNGVNLNLEYRHQKLYDTHKNGIIRNIIDACLVFSSDAVA